MAFLPFRCVKGTPGTAALLGRVRSIQEPEVGGGEEGLDELGVVFEMRCVR